MIEELGGVRIHHVSVGPSREQTLPVGLPAPSPTMARPA
jgi:hypothetical protein